MGWVDFSSEDRHRVSQILAMMREPGTLDELGIGQIRDTFANSLFPGFSTIQTKAKYFVIVPRIFRDYRQLSKAEQKKRQLVNYLQEIENKVAEQLVAAHSEDEEQRVGIIGSTRVGLGGVTRRPSSIYWNGLRIFGICNTVLSLNEFCRSYGQQEQESYTGASGDDGFDDSDAMELVEKVHIPAGGEQWLEELLIDLTRREAEFLRDKIRNRKSVHHSITAQLLSEGILDEALNEKLQSFSALSDWLNTRKEVSDQCRHNARLAEKFSRIMEGAHIRYKCLLAGRLHQDERLEELEDKFLKWRNRVTGARVFSNETTEEVLGTVLSSNVRLKARTELFFRNWCSAVLAQAEGEALDEIVQKQAVGNKGQRSLLKRTLPENTHLEGAETLDYRWSQARVILGDISKGLKC